MVVVALTVDGGGVDVSGGGAVGVDVAGEAGGGRHTAHARHLHLGQLASGCFGHHGRQSSKSRSFLKRDELEKSEGDGFTNLYSADGVLMIIQVIPKS